MSSLLSTLLLFCFCVIFNLSSFCFHLNKILVIWESPFFPLLIPPFLVNVWENGDEEIDGIDEELADEEEDEEEEEDDDDE